MKKKLQWILALLAVLVLLTGCKKEYVFSSSFKNDELFRVEKSSGSRAEYLVYLANMENQYAASFGEQIWQQKIGERTVEEDVRQTVFARLVKVKMMVLLAAEKEIDLTGEELGLVKKAAAEYYDSLSSSEIVTFGGIAEADIEGMYREYALADKVYRYYTDDVTLEISDDEVRMLKLKQIKIPFANYAGGRTREEAQSLINAALLRLQNGDGFDLVSAIYNEAEETNIEIRKGQAEQAVEAAVYDLPEGEVSQAVEGEDAYYLFYCLSAYDEAQVAKAKEQRLDEYKKKTFDSVYQIFASDKDCYMNQELWDELSQSSVSGVETKDFFAVYEKYFY